jgi:hypothetical protein
LAVYKAGNATPRTADITLDIAWNAVVGMHHVSIVTTNAFYALATDYTCIIAAGTVDGVSVVGRVLAHFSLENRKATIDAKEALTRLPDASPGGIDGRADSDGRGCSGGVGGCVGSAKHRCT